MNNVVKERPLICTAESVRGFLDRSKTQTRRVIKPQPPPGFRWCGKFHSELAFTERGDWTCWFDPEMSSATKEIRRCPFQVGMRLWVKEVWTGHWDVRPPDRVPSVERVVTDAAVRQENGGFSQAGQSNPVFVYYRATLGDTVPVSHLKWKSPIFMPRWASRITLELTDVRAQRLQEISEEDAQAEGLPKFGRGEHGPTYKTSGPLDGIFSTYSAVMGFAHFWDSINARRGFSWSGNWWVWALTCKVLDG